MFKKGLLVVFITSVIFIMTAAFVGDGQGDYETSEETEKDLQMVSIDRQVESQDYEKEIKKAHHRLAQATLNQRFDSDGDSLTFDQIQEMLKDAKSELMKIDDQPEEVQRIVEKIDQSIDQMPPNPEDRTYVVDAHNLIHELAEDWNVEVEDVQVTMQGKPKGESF